MYTLCLLCAENCLSTDEVGVNGPKMGRSGLKRPALVSLRQATVGDQVEKVMNVEGERDVEDLDLPIVDPADLLRPTFHSERLTLTSALSIGASSRVDRHWWNLLSELGSREGTELDMTPQFISYPDQQALTRARNGHVDLRGGHLESCLFCAAEIPSVLVVEHWLRDGIMIAFDKGQRLSLAKMWCVVVGRFAGAEAIRAVATRMEDWCKFDGKKWACSARSSEMVAKVASRRTHFYSEWLWTSVMMAVESSSEQVFWDWRRVQRGCEVHARLDCPIVAGDATGPTLEAMVSGTNGDDEDDGSERDWEELVDNNWYHCREDDENCGDKHCFQHGDMN